MNTIRCFELLEDLHPGSTAQAVLLKWKDGRYVKTAEQITLNEFVNSYADRGDRGYAYFSTESGRWEALSGLFEKISCRAAM